MPTADSFTALGRGNGFPFCPSKVDVSLFSNWITLGGVSSGSASKAQINESLKNAMKLWWNLHFTKGSFSCAVTNSEEGSISVQATGHELILKRIGESDALTPIQRACRGTETSAFVSNLSSTFKDEKETDDGGGGRSQKVEGNLTIGSDSFIVRMYNGSTDDENNFVGYGARTTDLVLSDAFISTPAPCDAAVQITVGSFLPQTNSSGVDPDSGHTFDQKVFQTNLGDMPFRSSTYCQAVNNFSGSGVTKSLSVFASELSGSASTNGSKESTSGDTSTFSVSISISASLSSIDFYTYD
tara:strand:- start:341 stop:1237 length:897 start_codon:yes stop_codon:yes gene_type:complete